MKKIIIQELFRALAIGWGTMIFLSFFYKSLGWDSGLVLLFAGGVSVLSFLGFTVYRSMYGKEMRIQTRRGWIIYTAVLAIVIFVYSLFAYNRSVSLLDRFVPILFAFIVLALGAWWGIMQARRNE